MSNAQSSFVAIVNHVYWQEAILKHDLKDSRDLSHPYPVKWKFLQYNYFLSIATVDQFCLELNQTVICRIW